MFKTRLGQAYKVLSARLDEGDEGDTEDGGVLSGVVTMTSLVHRSAVAGDLVEAREGGHEQGHLCTGRAGGIRRADRHTLILIADAVDVPLADLVRQ